LQDAIDAGDPAALADLGTSVRQLHEQADSLEAMATGRGDDPLPTPPSDVPADETGTSGDIS
jgi:hypothetical protein